MAGLSDFLPELYPSSVEDLETVRVVAGHIHIYRKLLKQCYDIVIYLKNIFYIVDLALQKCLWAWVGLGFGDLGPWPPCLQPTEAKSHFKTTTDDSSRWGWVGYKRPRVKKKTYCAATAYLIVPHSFIVLFKTGTVYNRSIMLLPSVVSGKVNLHITI